jgi:diadenosine tetraphosphate (Ap4A) HIT family hydrolase
MPERDFGVLLSLPETDRGHAGQKTKADLVFDHTGVDAAQVVPHVHYHIIPRPNERQREKLEATTPEDRKRWWKSPFGSGWRTDLYDEEGEQLAAALRVEVKREVEDLQRDPQKRSDTRFLASL